MKLVHEKNLFDSGEGLKIVTTNSTITKQMTLVMGRGAALEANKYFPNINRDAGLAIHNLFGNLSKYGFLVVKHSLSEDYLGLFQVKYYFSAAADLDLISYSTEALIKWIENCNVRYKTFHMNFPGIGFGRLDYDEVFKIIEILPDNVFVYVKK